MANDALNALARVHVFLQGDFIGCVFLENAADADVQAFGIFAEHHEIDVARRAIAQRSERSIQQFHGPGVDVEIELEAQAEQNVGGVFVAGHTRIAHRAEQDGVKFVAQHLLAAFGQRCSIAQIAVGAPVNFGEFEFAA